MNTLFEDVAESEPLSEDLGPGTAILRGMAIDRDTEIMDALFSVAARSPFRHMVTPGGFRMSVAMTNCGALGWVADRKGYRYVTVDPETNATLASHTRCVDGLGSESSDKSGLPFLRTRCLPHQSL